MRSFLSVMFVLIPGLLLAQEPAPEVDQAEVLRRGDLVQVAGDGIRSPEIDTFAEAVGPPASDADKWFISVLSMQGCAGCEKLKRDWTTSPWLLALANPTDAKQSWAHYNVYDKDDRSQSFRFERLRITTFPTILVQPPRSKRYGDPATIVFQSVYRGDPERLAREISAAIRHYVEKLQPAGPVRTAYGQYDYGVNPPWQPVPKVSPTRAPYAPYPNPPFPNSPLPSVDPTIPPLAPSPAPAPSPAFPWSAALTLFAAGFSLPAAVALAIGLVYYVRARRQAAGKPPLVDQATLDALLNTLKKLAEQPKRSASEG
jgi:hypothetical protein